MLRYQQEGGLLLKINIEITEDITLPEISIRCNKEDKTLQKLVKLLQNFEQEHKDFLVYKEKQELYIALNEIYFFETEGEYIYAHTASDSFRTDYRLYELEQLLPSCYVRVAKSAIINTLQIYAVTKNVTASALVEFKNSIKHVYISRRYYSNLKQKLQEKRNLL